MSRGFFKIENVSGFSSLAMGDNLYDSADFVRFKSGDKPAILLALTNIDGDKFRPADFL